MEGYIDWLISIEPSWVGFFIFINTMIIGGSLFMFLTVQGISSLGETGMKIFLSITGLGFIGVFIYAWIIALFFQ